MSYSLNKKSSPGEALKEVILEQIEKSRQQIAESKKDQDSSIHQIRKRQKKIRGALRLCRHSLGEDIYQRENAYFRDLANRLSPFRDAEALIPQVKSLSETSDDKNSRRIIRNLVRNLKKNKSSYFEEHFNPSIFQEIRKDLDQATERINNLQIKAESFGDLAPSLRKVYKRGYKAFPAAYKDPSPENFHEWRKRVKYLYFHYRLLEKSWPEVLTAFKKETKKLSDYLGDDHDLSVLQEKLESGELTFRKEQDLTDLKDLIASRKKELLQKAWLLGKKIYLNKSKSEVAKLDAWWETWYDLNSKNAPVKKAELV
jgi:CHAD domain-containing protein